MKTYLYRCWDVHGHVVFAGVAEDVDVRVDEHARTDFWWSDVHQVTRQAFATRLEAEWAQWAVIATCGPAYNRPASPPDMPPAPAHPRPRPATTSLDVLLQRYREHILFIDDACPQWWITGLPSVRQANAAIDAGRRRTGQTFNSISTTQEVLRTMRRLATTGDPAAWIAHARTTPIPRTERSP